MEAIKVYEVFEADKSHGLQYAESVKEAIRFTRMELFAAGVKIGDEGWMAVEA
jgi:hypothetical protein